MISTDMTECKECGKYLLYTHYDINGFKWWNENMDKDFTDDEELEMIQFRLRINNGVLEWYYGITPKKIYTKTFYPNSPFWIEFNETYCECYDDDDY